MIGAVQPGVFCMLATLFHCLDLLRLSGSPADVPPSPRLLAVFLLADAGLQALAFAVFGLPQQLWIESIVVRIGGIWLMLWLRDRPARLLQTLIALSGVSVWLSAGLLATAIGYRATELAPALTRYFELMALGLVGWLWLAGGLILARALAVPMPLGVAALLALQGVPLALRYWLAPAGAG
jgi:hypothetical protein